MVTIVLLKMMILIKMMITFRISCGKTSTNTRIIKEDKFSQEKWGHFWDSLQQITIKIIVSARLTPRPTENKMLPVSYFTSLVMV